MDQCMTYDLEMGGAPGGAAGAGTPGNGDCGVGVAFMVSVAWTSMFVGYAAARSMNDRAASSVPRVLAVIDISVGGPCFASAFRHVRSCGAELYIILGTGHALCDHLFTVPGRDFDTDQYQRNINLTDRGSQRVEEIVGCANLYAPENLLLLVQVRNALHADRLLHRDQLAELLGQPFGLDDGLHGPSLQRPGMMTSAFIPGRNTWSGSLITTSVWKTCSTLSS